MKITILWEIEAIKILLLEMHISRKESKTILQIGKFMYILMWTGAPSSTVSFDKLLNYWFFW